MEIEIDKSMKDWKQTTDIVSGGFTRITLGH